jgi:NhaP-type Na+/H+ or K+/H+ antiporter
MRAALIFPTLLMLCVATPAYAFNTFMLLDPAFQRFVLVEVPLMAMVGMGLLDALMLYYVLQPKDVSLKRMICWTMRTNLSCMFTNILLAAILMFYVTETLTETKYHIVILFAVVYFMATFAGYAWWRKAKFCAQKFPEQVKQQKRVLALTTVLGYGALYYYLYLKLFSL